MGDLRAGEIVMDLGGDPKKLLRFLRNRALLEEVGEVVGVGRVGDIRAGVENVLHGANIGGVRERDRAGIRKSVDVGVRAVGDDNLADGVIEVVWVIACDAIPFGFIPPEDIDAVVLFSV